MLLAVVLMAVPVSLELEIAGGLGLPSADAPMRDAPAAPALQARAGADFYEHVSISLALLGIAGGETARSFCAGGPGCNGNASFSAISGFATLRLHTAGDWQGFVEGGIGPGHLISLSGDALFENPALHGRGGPAYLLAGGGRWFVSRQVALGLELAWTEWTRVSRPEFMYGATLLPAESDLSVSAIMLLFSVGWSQRVSP
jgi:hypothetical protein